MSGSAHYHQLAFFQELTSGVGPANAAAWVTAMGALTTGGRIAPLQGSVDVAGILPSLLDDETARDDIFDDSVDLLGIDNPEFGFDLYAETLGQTVGNGTQPSHTAFSTILEHVLGGASLGTSRTASGVHSTTTITLDSVAGLAVGDHIAVVLSAYTGPGGATMAHPRRITDITGLIVTVDQAFPTAPVDTDIAYAGITLYVDSTVLEDSSTGPTTLSWHVSRDGTGGTANWEIYGSKAMLESISFERDDFAKCTFKVMGGGSDRPDTAAAPSWTSDVGNEAPMQVGRYTQVWLEDYGTTTNSVVACNSFSFTPGVPAVRAPTITTNADGLQGTACYTTKREDTTAEITLFPHDATRWTEFDARTLKACRIYNLAPPGSGFCLTMPRCEVRAPDFADVDGAAGNTFTLKALRDTTAVASTQLWRSKFSIFIY